MRLESVPQATLEEKSVGKLNEKIIVALWGLAFWFVVMNTTMFDLLVASGVFYTAERTSARIPSAIAAAGYASHGTDFDHIPSCPGLFNEPIVWGLRIC
jgi:hypothetical protein